MVYALIFFTRQRISILPVLGVFGVHLTSAAPAAGDAMKVVMDILKDLAAGNITEQGLFG